MLAEKIDGATFDESRLCDATAQVAEIAGYALECGQATVDAHFGIARVGGELRFSRAMDGQSIRFYTCRPRGKELVESGRAWLDTDTVWRTGFTFEPHAPDGSIAPKCRVEYENPEAVAADGLQGFVPLGIGGRGGGISQSERVNPEDVVGLARTVANNAAILPFEGAGTETDPQKIIISSECDRRAATVFAKILQVAARAVGNCRPGGDLYVAALGQCSSVNCRLEGRDDKTPLISVASEYERTGERARFDLQLHRSEDAAWVGGSLVLESRERPVITDSLENRDGFAVYVRRSQRRGGEWGVLREHRATEQSIVLMARTVTSLATGKLSPHV